MNNIESIRGLEINISILFNLDFVNDTILSRFFFLIIDLYFLIPTVITQIFNPITELINSYKNTSQRSKSRNGNSSSNCRN